MLLSVDNGDRIDAMPAVVPGEGFGTVRTAFTLSAKLGPAHAAVTGGALRADLASASVPPRVLVKGSRSSAMDRVVAALLPATSPEDATHAA